MNETTLLKLLTESGLGSRRKMADAIIHSKVKVNGITAENLRQVIDTTRDKVEIDGKPIAMQKQRTVYLMMNKPRGFLSTTSDEEGRRTVMSILPLKYRQLRLYPVGRLDKETTGLLVLTNDGNFTHEMTHPSFEHEKEYLVQIKDTITLDEKRKLERGIELEDGSTSQSVIKQVTNLAPFNYSIAIHEGRKRQVRRMFSAIGHTVISLKRVRTGNLSLGSLREGEMRELSSFEVRNLLKK